MTGRYEIITDKGLYRTDGISSLEFVCELNTKLLDDLIEFISSHVDGGFEVYDAINAITKLKTTVL